MAQKVNTKFVVGLTAGLLVVCAGVAGSAFYFLRNSASDLVSIGDKKLASGEIEDAVQAYSKAVNKEQTNAATMQKWIDALERYTPESDVKFQQQYREWISAKDRLATLRSDDAAPRLAFLEARWEMMQSAFDRGSWEQFAGAAEEAATTFAGKPEATRLLAMAGIARTRLAMEASDFSPTTAEKPDALLKRVLAANPDDADSALALIDMRLRLAQRALDGRRTDEAEQFEQTADTALDQMIAGSPDNAGLLLAKVSRNLSKIRRAVRDGRGSIKPEEANKQFESTSRPLYDRAYAALKADPGASARRIEQFRAAETFLDGLAYAKTEELLRGAIAKRPSEVDLRLALADVLASRGDFAKASEALGEIVEMPRLPVGNAGLKLLGQRSQALGMQALWAVRVWEGMPAGPDKDAALAKAKELKGELAKIVSADAPILQLVEAQLLALQETRDADQQAVRLVEAFNRSTGGGNLDSLVLTAQLSLRRNEPGKARDALVRVVQLQPTNVNALRLLARVQTQLQDTVGARATASQWLVLQPESTEAKQLVETVDAMAGRSESSDPVVKSLIEVDTYARENASQPKLDETLRDMLVKAAAQHDEDPRMLVALANAHIRLGEKQQAIAAIDKALLKQPDNPTLRGMRASIDADSTMDKALAQVEVSGGSDLDKHMSRATIYSSFGDDANAEKSLAAARAIDANDRRVIDMTFTRLIAAGKVSEARPLAEQAIRNNTDGLQGDSFRARMLLAEGKPEDGARVMQQVIDRGGASPEVRRLHARLLISAGKPTDAAESLRESLKARPNDPPVWTDLVEALLRAGKPTDALTAAREGRKFSEGDARFLEAFLAVEAEHGDRGEAIRIRERLAAASPRDRGNLVQLARYFLLDRQREKAKGIIDRAKAIGGGFDVVQLEATWHAGAGDLASASRAYEDYIKSLPEGERTASMFLAHASFLLDYGQGDAALQAAESGRAYQTRGVQEVDRFLSDTWMRFSQPERMIEASRAVVAADADTPDRAHQKRVVEGLVTLAKFDEASKEMGKLSTGDDADVGTLLIAAEVRRGNNDARGERELLDRAVSRFSSAPMAYIRRGQHFARANEMRDAFADLGRAVELAPTSPLPLRERARLHRQAKDENAMFRDLRAAMLRSPQETQQLLALLQELGRAGRESEMVDVASEVAALRTTDGPFLSQISGFFRSYGTYDVARDYARRAYTLDANQYFTQTYLDVLLEGPAPNISEAQRVLAATKEAATTNPGYIMARAKISAAQGKAPEAQRFALDAARQLDVKNPQLFSAWFNDLRVVIPDEGQRLAAIDQMQRAGVAAEWMAFFKHASQISTPSARAKALADLESLANSSQNNALKLTAARQLGGTFYEIGEYAKAEAWWRSVVELAPDDANTLNNLAYVMVKHLNKAQEAGAIAQRAVELNPNSPDAADTQGLIRLTLGDHAGAIPSFEFARSAAQSMETFVQASLHLAQAHLAGGNKPAGRTVLEQIDANLKNAPQGAVRAETLSEVERVRGLLAS